MPGDTKGSALKDSIIKYMGGPDDGKHGISLEKMIPTYGGLSSQYPTILPIEYYTNIIEKERHRADNEKWYLRPHHLESLTEHPFSLRDNILDSNYYAFYKEFDRTIDGPIYNPTDKEQPKPSENKAELIGVIEQQLANLKSELNSKKANTDVRASNLDHPGTMQGNLGLKELRQYQNSYNPEMPYDTMLNGYESVLDDLRSKEKDLLNNKREKVYEQKRNPMDKWYEGGDKKFTSEMKKNDNMLERGIEDEIFVRKLENREIY